MSRKYVVVFLKPAYDTVTAGTAEDATRIVRGVIPYGARVIACYPLGDEPPAELAGLDLPGNVKPVA